MDRIPDQLGYLSTFLDGSVISSSGDLENNEQVANIISHLVSVAENLPPYPEKYKKITILYTDFLYTICLSNNRIHIAKLRKPKQQPDINSEIVGLIN